MMKGMSVGAWIATILSWSLGGCFFYLFGLPNANTLYIPIVLFLGPYAIWKITAPKDDKS